MNLTAHFTLEELSHSDTAVRNGIDNTPPDDLYPNLMVLAEGSERVRYVLGCPMHPTSGYRCEELERIICSKDFSGWCSRHKKPVNEESWKEYFARKSHPKGLALDFIAPKYGKPFEIVKAIMDEKDFIGFEQVIEEGTWVHISFPPPGKTPKMEVLTAKFDKNGVASYTKGLR